MSANIIMANTVDATVLMKGLETMSNVSKIAANLSDKPRGDKKTYNEGDSTNQPHNQTVEVKVGDQGERKPVVVHEKKETHIHKPFPDSRSLTTEECEVEKLRIEKEALAKQAELDYRKWHAEFEQAERKEREAYARKERERKHEEDKKFFRRFLIGAGIIGAASVVYIGYDIYTSSRNSSSRRLGIPAPQSSLSASIEAEGTVK